MNQYKGVYKRAHDCATFMYKRRENYFTWTKGDNYCQSGHKCSSIKNDTCIEGIGEIMAEDRLLTNCTKDELQRPEFWKKLGGLREP